MERLCFLFRCPRVAEGRGKVLAEEADVVDPRLAPEGAWLFLPPQGGVAAPRSTNRPTEPYVRGCGRDEVARLSPIPSQQNTVCTVVNSFSPSAPNSTPNPDCLMPPNGALG